MRHDPARRPPVVDPQVEGDQGLEQGERQGIAGDEATRRELQDYVKAEIAPYKYPRAVDFVTVLPRTETGKIQRFRLREQERQRAAPATSSP